MKNLIRNRANDNIITDIIKSLIILFLLGPFISFIVLNFTNSLYWAKFTYMIIISLTLFYYSGAIGLMNDLNKWAKL